MSARRARREGEKHRGRRRRDQRGEQEPAQPGGGEVSGEPAASLAFRLHMAMWGLTCIFIREILEIEGYIW